MMASPGPGSQGRGARKSPENITQALGPKPPSLGIRRRSLGIGGRRRCRSKGHRLGSGRCGSKRDARLAWQGTEGLLRQPRYHRDAKRYGDERPRQERRKRKSRSRGSGPGRGQRRHDRGRAFDRRPRELGHELVHDGRLTPLVEKAEVREQRQRHVLLPRRRRRDGGARGAAQLGLTRRAGDAVGARVARRGGARRPRRRVARERVRGQERDRAREVRVGVGHARRKVDAKVVVAAARVAAARCRVRVRVERRKDIRRRRQQTLLAEPARALDVEELRDLRGRRPPKGSDDAPPECARRPARSATGELISDDAPPTSTSSNPSASAGGRSAAAARVEEARACAAAAAAAGAADAGGGASSGRPRSRSHRFRADEFQRFLTAFSVRPGRSLAISLQRLPWTCGMNQ